MLAWLADASPKYGDSEVEMILIPERALNSAVKAPARAFNQMKALIVSAPAEFCETLVSLTTAALVNHCESLRLGGMDRPVEAARYTLRPLARRYCQMGKEIRDLGAKVRRLALQAFPALVDTLGIATDMVATLVIAAGSNADHLHSEAAFAYLCGGNPIPASSGKTTGIGSDAADNGGQHCSPSHRCHQTSKRPANPNLHAP